MSFLIKYFDNRPTELPKSSNSPYFPFFLGNLILKSSSSSLSSFGSPKSIPKSLYFCLNLSSSASKSFFGFFFLPLPKRSAYLSLKISSKFVIFYFQLLHYIMHCLINNLLFHLLNQKVLSILYLHLTESQSLLF